MSDKNYLFSFIEPINEIAALNAKKMGELIYEDAASSIVKARLFAEEILNAVFEKEEIKMPYVSSMYDKIAYLAKEGYITPETQRNFDTIRLTGNKAAHDGSFSDITVAFKLHRVMYNIAVWFCEVYSSQPIKIPVYEQPKPPKSTNDEIEERVLEKVKRLLGEVQVPTHTSAEQVNLASDKQTLFNRNLPENQSYLLRELRRLQDSSQEAIENANAFSHFKTYLHVERKIQTDFEQILLKNKSVNSANLILLCGSVGDGKSHLLAYLKENRPDLMNDYEIFNDATESFSPSKNAMETLEEVLKDFSDQHIRESKKKVILAINMGVLHNFITMSHQDFTYKALHEFINRSDLFSQSVTTSYSEENFDLLSFSDYHTYELTEEGPTSNFFLTLLKKVFSQDEQNPFYLAYQEDMERDADGRTMVHENYEFMQQEYVQKQIVNLIIQTLVEFKLVISARAFLNFIADIVIPDQITPVYNMTEFERLEQATPTLLFMRKERSSILRALYELDPMHVRSPHVDELVIRLNTLSDWNTILDTYIFSEKAKQWLSLSMDEDESLSGHTFQQFSEAVIRMTYLTNEDFAQKIEDESYISYVKYLYYFNYGDKRKIKEVYDEVKSAVFKWKGSPERDYIYLNRPSDSYRLAQSLNLKPTVDHLKFIPNKTLESFKSSIVVAYHNGDNANTTFLDIDYPLYHLLMRVQKGYCPNKKDEEDAVKFVEFIERIMRFGNKKQELLVNFPNASRSYKLKRDDFGTFVFERE